MLFSLYLVLYAPHLGEAGLDNTDVKSRFEVYRIEYHCEEDDPSTVQRDMDETIPFYPEIVCYRVFSIKVGKVPQVAKCFLREWCHLLQMINVSWATMQMAHSLSCSTPLPWVTHSCVHTLVYIIIYTACAGHFQVAHQSPPIVYLPEGEQAVALYCVASNHTVLHSYQWENSGVALSGSTPVLWVNKEGIYKCTLKESDDSSSSECCSNKIYVHGTMC